MNPRLPLLLAKFDGPLGRFRRSLQPEIPPDPWPEEVDAAVRSPEAVPLCIDCLYPQEHHHWFWMLRRTRGRPICTEQRKEIEFEENA